MSLKGVAERRKFVTIVGGAWRRMRQQWRGEAMSPLLWSRTCRRPASVSYAAMSLAPCLVAMRPLTNPDH